jgi:hypothetical protein
VIRVLPSTSLAQTYMISPDGCPPALSSATFLRGWKCDYSRGNIYNNTDWLATKKANGLLYGASLSQSLVFNSDEFRNMSAIFWPDDVSLAYNATKQIARNVTVGLIDNPKFSWTGLLGLDVQPTSHTMKSQETADTAGTVIVQKSIIQTLKDAKDTASLSWAYHAGSYSRTSYSIS